ncbi:hypothetical protein ON010_g5562 [Phytophthora cinnamomi]|nr:hypothetical protein ON010_g5562 [Phytophthora cinnamomi]
MLSFPVSGDGVSAPRPAVETPGAAVTTTTMLIDLKQQQLVAAEQGATGPSPVEVDTPPQPEEFPLLQAPALRRRGIRTAFHLMTFPDSNKDSESDYEPSEGEEEEGEGREIEEEEYKEEGDDPSAEELFESYHQDTGTSEEEVEEVELDEDFRWWKSGEDKRRWEKRYRQADAAFRKRFGCAIDTPAQPETRRRLRREKNRHRAYKLVLAGLVVAYLVQLAVVYSASSWAFSMVAWRTSTTEESDDTRVNVSDGKVIDETRATIGAAGAGACANGASPLRDALAACGQV